MQQFKICFLLVLCVILFSGCLGMNDDMPEPEIIKASDPGIATFSGTVSSISASGNDTLIVLKTNHESYYGQAQMTFILNNETISDFHYAPEIDKYMFISYRIPADGNLQRPVESIYATVFYDNMRVLNGTVENIRRGSLDEIMLDNGTLIRCSSYPETYFTEDIKVGMEITLYIAGTIATTAPPICWPYEV